MIHILYILHPHICTSTSHECMSESESIIPFSDLQAKTTILFVEECVSATLAIRGPPRS